jgi:hypothetical protein
MTNRVLFSIVFAAVAAAHLQGADLRLGIIGTDTSHATAFAKALNDAGSADHVSGARIVIAYQGGSPDIKESSSRVGQFAADLRNKFGVRFVESIAEMCGNVDGILVESVDGRTHLGQVKQALQCGKPMFIDKPLASTLSDAREIARLADAAGVPWFTSSSLRFSDVQSLKHEAVKGASVCGPGPTEEHHALDLSWYGLHSVELLYTLMGPGCTQVTRTTSQDADVVTCLWKDGRLGTIRVDRPYSQFGAVVFRSNNRIEALPVIKVDYVSLVREIVQFMQTRKPPVPVAETLEIFQFLDAAQRSKQSGGKPAGIK